MKNKQPEALQRLGRNIRSSLAYQITGIAFSFVTLPFVIQGLGVESYGLWNTIGALFAFLGFTELMVSTTAVRFLGEARGRGKPAELKEGYHVLWISALAFGTALAGLVLLTGDWVLRTLFHFPEHVHHLARFVLWAQAAVLPFRLALTVDAGAIQAHQRLDLSFGIGMGYVIVHSLGMLTAVTLGGRLASVIIVDGLALIASALVHHIVARGLVPAGPVKAGFRVWWKRMSPYAIRVLAGYVATPLLVPISRLLLGVYRPLPEVGYFALAEKLASEVRAGATHIGTATMPAASELAGRSDAAGLATLFIRSCRWSLMTLAPVGVLAAIFGGRFIEFWVGPEFGRACEPILRVMVPALCLVFFSTVPGAVARGLGRPGPWALANLAAVGVNLAVGSVLIPRAGAVGAAWTLIFAGAATTFPLIFWIGRILGLKPADYSHAIPPKVILLGVLLAGAGWAALPWVQSLAAVFFAGFGGAAVFLAMLIAVVMTPEERASMRRILKWDALRKARG